VKDPFLAHFGVYRLRPDFWALPEGERAARGEELGAALRAAAGAVHLYTTFGTRAGSDLLAWSSVSATDPDAARGFLLGLEVALRPFRRHLEVVDALWGFTHESPYARGGSDRRMDPEESREHPYLVLYPFAKTHAWYRTPAEERRRMMVEHIRIGHEHDQVRQLLLYSAGLQDHEFVVVYETPDLADFSDLVAELRTTEGRAYTALDTPVRVGVLQPPGQDGAWG